MVIQRLFVEVDVAAVWAGFAHARVVLLQMDPDVNVGVGNGLGTNCAGNFVWTVRDQTGGSLEEFAQRPMTTLFLLAVEKVQPALAARQLYNSAMIIVKVVLVSLPCVKLF